MIILAVRLRSWRKLDSWSFGSGLFGVLFNIFFKLYFPRKPTEALHFSKNWPRLFGRRLHLIEIYAKLIARYKVHKLLVTLCFALDTKNCFNEVLNAISAVCKGQ